ncbi:hypothetical protein ACTHUE_19775, partial [Neisseria sp. P0021.S005]
SAYFDRAISRSKPYIYHIVNEVKKRNMPAEIALLSFIEGAFVTKARSHVGVFGLWWFVLVVGCCVGLGGVCLWGGGWGVVVCFLGGLVGGVGLLVWVCLVLVLVGVVGVLVWVGGGLGGGFGWLGLVVFFFLLVCGGVGGLVVVGLVFFGLVFCWLGVLWVGFVGGVVVLCFVVCLVLFLVVGLVVWLLGGVWVVLGFAMFGGVLVLVGLVWGLGCLWG